MSDVNNANKAVIGLLHPGEMGAAVGRCLTARGHEVLWASRGRGPDTAARAAAAGLADAGTVTALAARAQVIISVCPPHAALDVAWAVHGFGGLYVDANAISPGTAREVARLICESGGRYVDGGIVGPPPDQPGRSRLYLSGGSPSGTGSAGTDAASAGTDAASAGTDAAQVAALFEGTPLDTRIVGGTATAASAVKMAYAAWTKGTAALLLSVRALAREQGVEDALLSQWAESQPGLDARSAGAARSAAAKGWRWVGEMEEIAATMSAAGLPDGFHQAAAEIFRRSPRGAAGNDLLDQVLGELTGDSSAM
jgi:3-hydroxyisobutyrate dehydrogenase-like beta-hydroxyacid dehydrogenase